MLAERLLLVLAYVGIKARDPMRSLTAIGKWSSNGTVDQVVTLAYRLLEAMRQNRSVASGLPVAAIKIPYLPVKICEVSLGQILAVDLRPSFILIRSCLFGIALGPNGIREPSEVKPEIATTL
jgi:hypothetical protein